MCQSAAANATADQYSTGGWAVYRAPGRIHATGADGCSEVEFVNNDHAATVREARITYEQSSVTEPERYSIHAAPFPWLTTPTLHCDLLANKLAR